MNVIELEQNKEVNLGYGFFLGRSTESEHSCDSPGCTRAVEFCVREDVDCATESAYLCAVHAQEEADEAGQ